MAKVIASGASALGFVFSAFTLGLANAQLPAWQPSPPHKQIELWPGPAPDARPVSSPENETKLLDSKDLIAGRAWTYVGNVSRPTMTVHSPASNISGTAIVVFPGGGYEILAIDLEGTEVCDWLTSTGITCILLKYRVPGEGRNPKSGPYPQSPMALEDAQRARGLVRFYAARWHIDPHKVGVLGFSAGGRLAAAVSTHFEHRLYAPVDAADRQSCRPDFAAVLYPGHLSSDWNTFALNSDLRTHISRERRRRSCCRMKTTAWTM